MTEGDITGGVRDAAVLAGESKDSAAESLLAGYKQLRAEVAHVR